MFQSQMNCWKRIEAKYGSGSSNKITRSTLCIVCLQRLLFTAFISSLFHLFFYLLSSAKSENLFKLFEENERYVFEKDMLTVTLTFFQELLRSQTTFFQVRHFGFIRKIKLLTTSCVYFFHETHDTFSVLKTICSILDWVKEKFRNPIKILISFCT